MSSNIYVAYSLLQKGCRLNNYDIIMRGGTFLEHTVGSEKVLKYLKNTMLFEDIRSSTLALESVEELDWKKLAVKFASIRKRWQREKNTDVYQIKLKCFEAAHNEGPWQRELDDSDFATFEKAMKTYFRMRWLSGERAGKENKVKYQNELYSRLKQPLSKELAAKVKATSFLFFLLLEIEYGKDDPSQNSFDALPITPSGDGYLYDHHTARGMKNLKDAWPIKPGVALSAKLNSAMPYAGCSMSQLWRYCAILQYGRININWEDVKIDEQDWHRALLLDSQVLSKKLFLKLK